MFRNTHHIHFTGIGGIGMSGMAELLYNLGFKITGSDIDKSERVQHLEALGININIGHSTSHIDNSDVLVYSSAINKNNLEITYAQKNNIPVIRRSEMLGELLKVKSTSIAVSGTHGKTTTSSMLGCILIEENLKPTLVIGGVVNEIGSNSMYGDGEIIVVEADEFDRSFLSLNPTMAIVTNLDLEHLDCYKNIDDLKNTFAKFSNSIPFYGKVAINIDNDNNKKLCQLIKKPLTTFGFSNNAYFQAKNETFDNLKSNFDLYCNGKKIIDIDLMVPGKHNIYNALGAISIALELNISPKTIRKGLKRYSGVWRRFEIKYQMNNGIIIIDDYAHHPSEVDATLNAIKLGWKKRIITIFQPHLYSRTRDFYRDFSNVLLKSDMVIITDIYPARETPIKGITGKIIVDEMKKLNHSNVFFIQNKKNIPQRINDFVEPNDIIITMGAGDIWRQIDNIYNSIKNNVYA